MKAARLAWQELQRFRGPRLQWVPAALVLLPVVAAAMCWTSLSNPQGRFSHVPAAIVNLDKATTSAAGGTGTTAIQAGQRLAEDLTLQHSFAWRELNATQALQQLKAGRIYFALVIPADFSSAIAHNVQRKDGPAASLILQLDDANGYLIGTAASAEAGNLKEHVTTLVLDYMAQQTTDVWKDVRASLDKVLDTDMTRPAAQDQTAPTTGSQTDQLATSLGQASTAMSQINDTIQAAKNNSGTMASQLNNAAASAQSAQDSAGSNNPALVQQSTNQANTAVRLAQNSVTGLDGQLQSAASTTKALLEQISTDAKNTEKFSKETKDLRQQLQQIARSIPPSPADDTSNASRQIVTVQQRNLHPSTTLGRGLAPLFLTLTSALTCLVALSILRPFNNRALASTVNAFTVARAGWLPLAVVTALVTCGLLVCALALMKIGVVYAWAALAVCLLISACFAAIGHLLKVSFGILGEGLLLLLLALQFGAAGGLYPVETTNALFTNTHPYLPMTYAVEALRVAVCGGQAIHLWHAVSILAGTTVGCLLLSGLVLSRRRQWTAERLASSSRERYG
ncbi:YhgE/Pip domain-containing protein [Streptomyces sp. NPDC058476]|uniref:YhgE/Pip domain-containing protein n=1 Tax=Streptomyces sp. NPDC058476 TaxID=3346519 RepID=UPI00364611B0